MACGFVLVAVKPTTELEVYGKLLKLEGIVEVCPVLGPVDFIVRVQARDHNEIAMLVLKHIRTIKGVTDTKTFVEDEFLKQLQGIAD